MIIDEILAVAKRRLAELDAEAVHLRALVEIYERNARATNTVVQGHGGVTTQSYSGRQDDGPGRRTKPVSAEWLPILSLLRERRDDTVHMDEINAFSENAGLGHTRDRLRAQLHNWKQRGWVENPAQSMFRITDAGIETVAEVTQNDNGADPRPAPSPTFESRSDPDADHYGPDPLNSSTAHGGGG